MASRPDGDVWNIVDNDKDSQHYMEVTLGKTEKGEPIIHKVFINELVKDIWIIYTTFGIRTKTWISLFPAYPIVFMLVLSIVIRNLIMKNSNEDMEESEEV